MLTSTTNIWEERRNQEKDPQWDSPVRFLAEVNIPHALSYVAKWEMQVNIKKWVFPVVEKLQKVMDRYRVEWHGRRVNCFWISEQYGKSLDWQDCYTALKVGLDDEWSSNPNFKARRRMSRSAKIMVKKYFKEAREMANKSVARTLVPVKKAYWEDLVPELRKRLKKMGLDDAQIEEIVKVKGDSIFPTLAENLRRRAAKLVKKPGNKIFNRPPKFSYNYRSWDQFNTNPKMNELPIELHFEAKEIGFENVPMLTMAWGRPRRKVYKKLILKKRSDLITLIPRGLE